MASAGATTDRFQGFPEGGMQFFLELQAEQSRTWFKAHQEDFARLWRQPLELFVAELQQRLSDVYPDLPEVSPHYFRIQRDTRFAKDKTPYKTYVAADLPLRLAPEGADQHSVPGLYVSFGLEGEYVAFGAWHMSPEALQRYRAALDHAQHGAQVQSIVDDLLADGWKLEAMETLKRTPTGFAQDHPRAELLKRKGLAVATSPRDDILTSPRILDWAEERFRRVAPLAGWIDRHLS